MKLSVGSLVPSGKRIWEDASFKDKAKTRQRQAKDNRIGKDEVKHSEEQRIADIAVPAA